MCKAFNKIKKKCIILHLTPFKNHLIFYKFRYPITEVTEIKGPQTFAIHFINIIAFLDDKYL